MWCTPVPPRIIRTRNGIITVFSSVPLATTMGSHGDAQSCGLSSASPSVVAPALSRHHVLPVHQLVSKTLEEIALAGREGIALKDLFQRVLPPPTARDHQGMEVLLWKVLRKMTDKLEFYVMKGHETNSKGGAKPLEAKRTDNKRKRNDVEDSPPQGNTKKKLKQSDQSSSKSPEQPNECENAQSVLLKLDDSSDWDAICTDQPSGRVQVEMSSVSVKKLVMAEITVQVVACLDLRFRALGVQEKAVFEVNSMNFDVLEMIGKAHERGVIVSELAKRFTNGNMVKVHYPLDVLIGKNLVQKSMVVSKGQRFNIVHLKRLAHKFHPTMIGNDAYFEDRTGTLELADIIAHMIRSRNEDSCVFADIGRELGQDKRVQERVRKNFEVEARLNPDSFPLELFQARCNSRGGESKVGRKLWCVRLRNVSGTVPGEEGNQPLGVTMEQGIMEQVFALIRDRAAIGTTVPDIRDLLVVPSFKLPYRLAQLLMSSYGLRVEKVIIKRNTLYRMYPPAELLTGEVPQENSTTRGIATEPQQQQEQQQQQQQQQPLHITTTNQTESEKQPEPPSENIDGTLKQASSNSIVFTTIDDRRRFIMERLQQVQILQIHQLVRDLNQYEMEKDQSRYIDMGCAPKFRCVDKRTVSKIITELVNDGLLCRMKIAVPCRMVRSRFRETQCVALAQFQKDKDAIKGFIARCREAQEQKIRESYDVTSVRHVLVKRTPNSIRSVHPTSTVTYRHVTNRKKLNEMSLQAKRLGCFFGVMYRIRALHLLLLKRFGLDHPVPSGEANATTTTNGADKTKQIENSWTFSITQMLGMFSVKEFIQIIGLSDLLSSEEEHLVSLAIRKNDTWDSLPSELQRKVRVAEIERSHRFLRVMSELKLIDKVDKPEVNMVEELALSSTGDVDEVVSRAVYRTISGSTYRLFQRVRMHLRMGSKILTQKFLDQHYVFCAQFSFRSTTEVISGRVPLQYEINSIKKALEYWKALAALCVHGGELRLKKPQTLGTEEEKEVSKKPKELVLPSALRDHNPRNMRTWSAFATGTTFVKFHKPRKVQRPTRRRIPQQGDSTLPSKKKRATLSTSTDPTLRKRSSNGQPASAIGGEAFTLKHRRGARLSERQRHWTHEQDLKLMEIYLDRIPYFWLITIPLSLQVNNESIAFRSPELHRTKFTWKGLGKIVHKSPVDCMRRIKELTPLPGFRSKLQKLRESFTLMKNPGGVFHEEEIIKKTPSLSALLILALQIIFHERASYYSVLANSLISRWKENEVRLVWRYLWIRGITCTPRRLCGDNQKERGFVVHRRLSDSRIPGVLVFPKESFCSVAEYGAFVKENLVEELESNHNNSGFLEQEVLENPSLGQNAFELSSMVMGTSVLLTECVEPEPDKKKQKTETNSKRSLKGFEGHMQMCGVESEDFLTDYWNVKSRVFAAEINAQQLEQLQAFSTSNHFETLVTSQLESEEARQVEELVGSRLDTPYLMNLLNPAGSDGMTIEDLVEALKPQDYSYANWALDKLKVLLTSKMQQLVASNLVVQVNDFTSMRYVAKQHSDIWLSHPYRFEEDVSASTTDANLRFVFDKEHSIVSRPWRHLDGSLNVSASSFLKRKAINIVMSLPGISEQEIRRRMLKALGVVDTRTLLMELVDDGLLYARAVQRVTINRKRRLFENSLDHTTGFSINIVTSKDIPFFNDETHRLVLFPSVNCMQRLGELFAEDS